MPIFIFAENRLPSDTPLTRYPKRTVTARGEAAARSRLPKPRAGRKWQLISTSNPGVLTIDGVRIQIPEKEVPLKDYMGREIGTAKFDVPSGTIDAIIDMQNPYGRAAFDLVKVFPNEISVSLGPIPVNPLKDKK